MKKKKSRTVAPKLPAFRVAFLKELPRKPADPTLARIVSEKPSKGEQPLSEFCANLFWLMENGTSDDLNRQTAQRRKSWETKFANAISGLEDAEFIYREYQNPRLAGLLKTIGSDLRLKQQRVSVAFAKPKHYGTDRNWQIVEEAKKELESRLKQQISSKVMADLLTAAAAAVGRIDVISEQAVTAGINRFKNRNFDLRIKPALERKFAKHYPNASDLPTAS